MKAGMTFLLGLLLLISFNTAWAQLGQMDTLYVVPVNTTLPPSGPGEVEFQFRFKTDNGPQTHILYYSIAILYATTNSGSLVHFHTDTSYVFSQTVAENMNWQVRKVVDDPENDTSGTLVVGALSLEEGFTAGDYLLANIKISISDTSHLILDTTSTGPHNTDLGNEQESLGPIVWKPGGYSFKITRQPPAVPTLSRWGMISFAILLTSALIVFLRRRRAAIG